LHHAIPFVLSEVEARAAGGTFGAKSFDFAQDERHMVL
jgi:hypothetical protein